MIQIGGDSMRNHDKWTKTEIQSFIFIVTVITIVWLAIIAMWTIDHAWMWS